MSYVSEKIRYEFESVPIELKSHILEKNVELHDLGDLISALKHVISEGDALGNSNIKALAHATLGKIGNQPLTGDNPAKVSF